MKHPSIEFITACACCATLGDFVKEIAPEYPKVETRVYIAGEDTDYIPKYGAVTSSILIMNESEVLSDLSKSSIREAFEKLSASAS